MTEPSPSGCGKDCFAPPCCYPGSNQPGPAELDGAFNSDSGQYRSDHFHHDEDDEHLEQGSHDVRTAGQERIHEKGKYHEQMNRPPPADVSRLPPAVFLTAPSGYYGTRPWGTVSTQLQIRLRDLGAGRSNWGCRGLGLLLRREAGALNGRFSQECLKEHWFLSVADVQVRAELRGK